MKKDSHIILSYGFDGNGGGKPLKGKEISKKIKSKEFAWVHMDATHPDTREWLHAELDYLDPFVIEELLAEETRPRIIELGDGALIILRGVNLNENADFKKIIS